MTEAQCLNVALPFVSDGITYTILLLGGFHGLYLLLDVLAPLIERRAERREAVE